VSYHVWHPLEYKPKGRLRLNPHIPEYPTAVSSRLRCATAFSQAHGWEVITSRGYTDLNGFKYARVELVAQAQHRESSCVKDHLGQRAKVGQVTWYRLEVVEELEPSVGTYVNGAEHIRRYTDLDVDQGRALSIEQLVMELDSEMI
jgi:hypothetical protein